VPDRVHTAVQSVKLPGSHAVGHAGAGYSQRKQLASSNHTVLPRRQRGNRPPTCLRLLMIITRNLKHVRAIRRSPGMCLTLLLIIRRNLMHVAHAATMAEAT
jgi:hypothetical protein